MAKHDWKQISKDYIEGIANDSGAISYPTQRELAEKYNVTPALIGRHAKMEQWLTKREIFNSKIEEKRQQKKAEVISDDGRDFDLQCFNLAESLRLQIDNMLAEGLAASPKAMSLLTASLKNLQAIGKAALGDDKSSESQELTIKVGLSDAET